MTDQSLRPRILSILSPGLAPRVLFPQQVAAGREWREEDKEEHLTEEPARFGRARSILIQPCVPGPRNNKRFEPGGRSCSVS